ncbi:NAD P-binding protein [Gloeophyllum trabeum ATCC 11539]|uniref:NAD P-binding protein n=1 Tax=Gloeophyllum trabeum (strain ATCC 11539 / FP-39264 / Madison 617) TaxID=670483 RepID=S7Q498_GLOTA|nr:NAD P-binding protein [Gloeophyllum trabeum ATCC 11539]EPQ54337.1 NAD P-binding protein [Gloeophyllum trabeum ATCC 11539]
MEIWSIGIGRMIATALENNGATVYIVGRRLEVLETAAKESNKFGKLIPLQGDVTSKDSLLSLVETLGSRHGYINLLVNNSGVMFAPQSRHSLEPVKDIKELQARLWDYSTPEQFAKTFEVNCTAVYFTTVAFLELLDAGNHKGGIHGVTSQVITVSSIAGMRRDSQMFSAAYSMSKAAVTHLGKLLANILKDQKIRSNIIAPGLYPSEMTAEMWSEELVQKGVPLQRGGEIQDMGGLALFLASRAGAYVNGTLHISDGGRLGLFSSTY